MGKSGGGARSLFFQATFSTVTNSAWNSKSATIFISVIAHVDFPKVFDTCFSKAHLSCLLLHFIPLVSLSLTLIISDWLLFLSSSFKYSHFSRFCPQPLSWVISSTPISYLQGESSQLSTLLLRSSTIFPSPLRLLPWNSNRAQTIPNQTH